MARDITLSEDATCLKISGPLNVDTVVRLRELGAQLIKTMQAPLVDLQDVTTCDSTALALLTALARDVKVAEKEVRFINVPPQLMAIAQLSALDRILTLSGG